MINQELRLQALCYAEGLYKSLRKNVLKDSIFPWQEVSLVIDCFIKMEELLPFLVDWEEKDIAFKLMELYAKTYKQDIDKRLEIEKLYIYPYFESLITHLYETKKLKNSICHIVNEIKRLRNNWEDPNEEYLQFLALSNEVFSPNECLVELSRMFSEHKRLTCYEEYTIERNKKKEFFSIPLEVMELLDNGSLNYYDSSNSIDDRIKKLDDAACVWPFKCGYARILHKDGRWGYVSQENNMVKWLEDKVLYAYDFCCDRARVQYSNMNGSYSFLGLNMEDCFHKRFTIANDFVGGIAVVSDEYCDNFQIDVWGNVARSDKYRYEENKRVIIQEREKSCQIKKKGLPRVYDPESEIMDSLSGQSADPEIFGY